MNSQPVIIKSSKNGINLVLDDTIPFRELLEEIKKKFIDSEKFFKNAHIAISFEGRSLSQEEEFEIIEAIQQCTTINIICILDHDELMDEVMQRRIGAYQESHSPQTGQFYKGTLRSGQQIESQTSLIVLGDVNPGAKVIAKGNIVVLGALKGIAYAGADGDPSCFVAALEFQSCNKAAGVSVCTGISNSLKCTENHDISFGNDFCTRIDISQNDQARL